MSKNWFEEPITPAGRHYGVGDIAPKGPAQEFEAPPPVADIDYRLDVRTFITHRPWEACKRCQALFKIHHGSMFAAAPEDGETPGKAASAEAINDDANFVCPHNDRAAYLKTPKEARENGKIVTHRDETLKNGCVQVTILWAVLEAEKPRRQF